MSQNRQEFVHLHVHSEYSLLDGLSRIDELVQRAVELKQPALALTDHGAMYGTMPFYRACRRAKIKPIIGIETYLSARRMQDRDPQLDKNRSHMLLLAQNQTGYLNLLQIASAGQLEGYYYKPRIDREFMAQHSEGLIATTGCMAAEIPRAIQAGKLKVAHKLMGQYLDIFGRDRFFVELQEHNIKELTHINKTLVEMASRYNLRFLATNDVHYTRAEDADPHDILLCIQTSALVSDSNRMRFSDKGYYLKSYDEMHSLFGHIPDALANSLLIAEMCDVNLDFEGYHLPDFEVPEGFDMPGYLRHLCEQGLVERYGENRARHDEALRQRLDHELNVIDRMGFSTYFLIVWDLCEWAARSDAWWEQHRDPYPYSSYEEWKKNDIWFNVRGSGAGSVVAYTLGITCIEPLANDLIFERFLNPGRVSMPDIDLDYPDDVRHEMVEYTMRRYGHERVAQIITFGTMGARAAIRDVGRALNMSLAEVDGIARMVPAIPGKPAKIDNVLDKEHEFYSADLEERYRKEKAVRELIDTARNLEGVARHASSHAAGVIISDKPLHEYVPLNRPTSGDAGLGGLDRVTQWPMEVVESIGLLKVDFLGLSTLTIMRRAARIIEERYGVVYTMDNIPYDAGHEGPDPTKRPEALFEMLSRGQVAGVFQVEGAGMRRLMMEMKPRRFDHIIAAISLYRPGPMENIPSYIRRMHGEEEVRFHHPGLEPILGDTYGICVSGDAILMNAQTGQRYRLDELVTIDDFVVQGVDENWQPAVGRVTHWIDSGYKDVYKVTLRNGASIKVTADHRLLTEDGWQALRDLNVGDYIATPPHLIGPDQTAALRVDRHNVLLEWLRRLGLKHPAGSRPGGVRSHEKFVPSFVFSLDDEDIALFLASLWDCDGYVGPKLCHYKTVSSQLAVDVQSLLLRFGIQSTCYTSTYETTGGLRTGYQVTVYDTKRLMGWLRPFMVSTKQHVSCASQAHPTIARKPFIAEVNEATDLSGRALMATYGISRQHFISSKVQKRPRIAAHIVAPLAETLDLRETKRRLNVNWEPIVTIEHVGPEHVYDITVAGLHSFVANNIVVHNCVYQEQIIRIASELAGYDPGEADIMRKAVGKKIKKLLDENRAKFTRGAMAKGLSRDVCNAIWGDIEFFARYGFNKAHAADYAKVTCQTAFLKAHYPVEYLCAMLSVERDKTDKVRRYFTEAKNLGIEVVPPDVNLSRLDFSIEDNRERPTIRFGLGAIKNAGEGALQLILEERQKNGSFQSLQDLCERVDLRRVGKRALEYMIKARAIECWGTPAQLMDALDRMVSYSGGIHSAAAVGQMSLFGGPALQIDVDLLHSNSEVAPVPHKQMLEWEKEALGVHVSEHPLERPLALLQPHTNATIGEIDGNWNGKAIKLAGMISQLRTLTTKKGEPMAFGTLEDLDDKVEVVFFPRTWKECRADVKVDQVMLVMGKVQVKSEDQITVIADRIDTNLEVAQDADAAKIPVKPDMEPQAPANGQGKATATPVAVSESVPPSLAAESRRGAPAMPPPPDFDEGWPTIAEPTPATPAVADVAAEPQTTSPGNGQSLTSGPEPVPSGGNGKTQMVVIEIRPVSNWRETCRDALRRAGKFEGSDTLRLSVPGQGLIMDFPNQQTDVCPELLEALRELPGVARVYKG